MSKPTQKQVEAEINRLRDLQPRVRHFTMFHDDNRAAVGIQIRVLEGELDEDAVEEQLANEDITQHEYDNALEALQWLAGEGSTATLSEEWEPLAEPAE